MTAPKEKEVVCLESGGCKAWVEITGTPQPTYKSKQSLKKLSCYVESQEGAAFTVHFRDERPHQPDAFAVELHLDGVRIDSYALDRASSCDFRGKRISATEQREFIFNPLQLTDEGGTEDESIIKNLGSIQLKVLRFVRGSSTPSQSAEQYQAEKSKVVNEMVKKASLSHSTGLGASKVIHPSSRVQVAWIDPVDDPHMTFEFMYRSRALLEIGGIVPASDDIPVPAPAPGPSQVKPKIEKKRKPNTIVLSDDEDIKPKTEPHKKFKKGEVIVIDD